MKAKKPNKWFFLLRFLIAFAIIYLLWNFSAPLANRVFTFFGGNILMLFDGANYTRAVEPDGEFIVVVFGAGKNVETLNLEYKGFTFNTVLLLALILAVPDVNYKLRLKILILGMVVLYPIQIIRLVIFIFNYYCQNMGRRGGGTLYPQFTHNAIGYVDKTLIRIDGQIIPVFIWAGLFYYYKWHNVFTKMMKKRSA